jgi:hypothetical protein
MMRSTKKIYGFLIFFLVASFAFLSGCNEPTSLQSKWRDKDIVVDANDDEWQDIKQYYDEKTKTSISICNDEYNIYMCLTTTDIEIMKELIKSGFIIWFNGKGTNDKEFGIRYPVVEQAGEGGQGAPGGRGGQGAPGGQSGNSVSVAELKLLTSEKDKGTTFKLEDAAKMGIFARIANPNDKLIYEIKIPLNKTQQTPYAAVASATHNLGVGFMFYGTKKRSASGISGFGGGIDMSGSGSSGGGGGGPGGGGGGPGGGGGGMDSRDNGFSTRDVSSMSNVFSFFNSNDETVTENNNNVSVINAQGGPGGGGGGPGGGGGGGSMGGGDMGGGGSSGMGGGMAASSQTKLEVWFNVTLANK